jgi:sugar diacid utilization regulator
VSETPAALAVSARVREGEEAYRQLAEVYNHLTALALQGADVATVTEILAERMSQAVAVLEASLEPLTMCVPPALRASLPGGWPATDERLGRMLVALGETRRAVRLPAAGPKLPALVAGPIIVAGETVAYVVTFPSSRPTPTADFDLLVTEHAATVFAVVMSRDQVLAGVAGQVREDLIDALLVGRVRTAEDRQRWAQHLGYRQDRPHRCLVIAVEGIEFATDEPGGVGPTASALRRSIHQATLQTVSARAPSAIVAARREEVVVLAERDADSPSGLGARKLAELLAGNFAGRYRGLTITVGVGSVCSHVDEVSESYEQALRAVRAARSLGRAGQAVAFEDLGLFRLLLQVPQLGELRAFAQEVFGDLLDYEARRRLGLLRTLSAYLRHNGSLQGAGEELHLHPNTVGYRLRRIEELSGLRLDRYQDRLMAQVALTIIEGLGASMVSREGR